MRGGLRQAVALLLAAGPLGAQVVRGVVRDATTRAPIPGVIVSLDEAERPLVADGSRRGSSLVLAVLTNARGEFSVRAAAAGRYVLSAKRVGVRRHESAPFPIAVGEARYMDIALSPIDFTTTLATVAVTADSPCSVDPDQRTRVAALWDEARAALTAARLSLRDRLFRATMVRYVRELRPGTLRVVREDQAVRRGVTENPFVSLAAPRLSADGFMQRDRDGASVFYAPDAAVLTSPEFLRDHCFSLARDARTREGLVGLAFEPVRHRTQPDISGALWMDSTNYELRLVEFRYTNLPDFAAAPDARGEVRFGRLPNGAWYVTRWFIRMPEYRAARASPAVPIGARPELAHYREEGGDVSADGATGGERGAVLHGRALDSTGRGPLRGAVVRLAGTRYATTVNADGSFRLDSLPAGAFTLTLEHPAYTALGMLAAEQDLEIAGQGQSVTVLQALTTAQVLRRLCSTDEFGDDRAAARVVVLGVDGHAAPDVTVRARFDTFQLPNTSTTSITIRPLTQEGTTDGNGAVMLCNLPARRPIRFEAAREGEGVIARQVATLRPQEVTVVTLAP